MIALQRSPLRRYFYLYKKLGTANMASAFQYPLMEEDVLFEDHTNKGLITLNRPQVLNSLNLSMVKKLKPVLTKWEVDKSLVVIRGCGDRAFCAGGDVKAIAEEGLKGNINLGAEFFREEYILNGIIGNYKKPYVALIDGIVMGGGVGLSVHGQYRVATERTLFAMPEMTIGLFPDVGGSYFLPRLCGKLGMYLALTGARLKGSDVVKAGIATHFCPSSKLQDLQDALLNKEDHESVIAILNKFHTMDDKQFSLEPVLDKINSCFAVDTVEGILAALKRDRSEWALTTVKALSRMSPTSLKIALKELCLGEHMNLLECLEMEYRLAIGCLRNNDFYEGVRALLIDKDQEPNWTPPHLNDVTDKLVNSYFQKLPGDKELKHKM